MRFGSLKERQNVTISKPSVSVMRFNEFANIIDEIAICL